MNRPKIQYQITDERTYFIYDGNFFTIDWEKYAKDLEKYIDYLESKTK